MKKMNEVWSTAVLVGYILTSAVVADCVQDKSKTVNNRLKIIVDTDAGIVDAMGISYLLRAEKHANETGNLDGPLIKAITTLSGNVALENVVVNVLKTLSLSNRLDIPVYKGAASSLCTTCVTPHCCGQDGLGDVPWPGPPSADLLQEEHAVDALIRLVDEDPGEITLLAMGPLTNIALATRLDPDFLNKLKRLIIVGGCVEGICNKSPGVEYNFFSDPIAVHLVLNATDFPKHRVVILPLEASKRVNLTMDWRANVLGKLSSREISFFNKGENITGPIKKSDSLRGSSDWQAPDVIAAALAIQDDVIQRIESYGVTTVTDGPTRGSIAVDYMDTLKAKQKIDIIYEIDSEKYKNSLIKIF